MSSSNFACGGSSPTTGISCPNAVAPYSWYLEVGAPLPGSRGKITDAGGTFAFDNGNCLAFSLTNGNRIPWVTAMNSGWLFWVQVTDPQQCSSNGFNFRAHFCGSAPYVTPATGSVAYPGSFHVQNYTELKVPLTDNRALRFKVTAQTNCGECICYTGSHALGTSQGCVGYANPLDYFSLTSSWTFETYRDYTAADVDYAVNTYPNTLQAGILQSTNFVGTNCANGNSYSQLSCP